MHFNDLDELRSESTRILYSYPFLSSGVVWSSISPVDRETSQVHSVARCVLWEKLTWRRQLKCWRVAHRCTCTWQQLIAYKVLICWYFSIKFWPFKVISKYILVNFQTNPTIGANILAFVHELVDGPLYLSKLWAVFIRRRLGICIQILYVCCNSNELNMYWYLFRLNIFYFIKQ